MQSTSASTFSRRQFLRGDLGKTTTKLRPPWALPEHAFVQRCTKCNACVEKCPEKIIVKDDGAYPVIDFELGGCTFCQDCVSVCDHAALSINNPEQAPWTLRAVISADCISLHGVTCRSCADSCDEQAISFRHQVGGISHPLLNQQSCTACGFCIATCPVKAINISEKKSEANKYGNN